MSNQTNVAVFGLGSMGAGMAGSVLKAGFSVWGFDVNQEAVQRFVDQGGQSGSVSQVGPLADVVVLAVLNAEQTESVLFGVDGIAQHLKSGSCVVACATVAPSFAKEMEQRCQQAEILYIDAPMSGGSLKAASGDLSFMASGSPQAFKAADKVIDAMSQTVFRLGDEAGPGSAMKAVNQLLAGVHIASMAEAMTFGLKQGISAEQIVDVITQSAGNSWMFENRAPHIVAGDYTPHSAVDIWPKDLGIVLDIARQEKFSAPLATTALQQFVAASGSGLGKEDDAAVAKIYARNANVKLP